MTRCYIGLGSNLDGPGQQIARALEGLGSLASCKLVRESSCYRSKPVGPVDQPDFVNAVAELETDLSALELLSRLQEIESDHGRVRKERWGPRTLDLDLLLFADEEIDHPQLKVPHPEMPGRGFVLIPLYEIAPELTIPGMGKLADLAQRVDQSELEIIDDG